MHTNVETINFGQHAKIQVRAAIKDPEDPDTILVGLYNDIYVIEVRCVNGKIALMYYKRDYETGDFEMSWIVEVGEVDINNDIELDLELRPKLRQIIKAIVEGEPIKNTYVVAVTVNNNIQKTIKRELDITDIATQFRIDTHNVEIDKMEVSKEW